MADTALFIINASPTITPQDEPTLAPPIMADINMKVVAKTVLNETQPFVPLP